MNKVPADNDENAVPGPGKQQLNNILAARRSVLRDVSNAVNPSVVNKTTLLPKRNLRATTIQASLAIKSKTFGTSQPSSATVSGRPSLRPLNERSSLTEAKENIAPNNSGLVPKRSMDPKDVPHDDLDAEDMGDHMMVAEYAPEIFEYMLGLEKNIMPGPGFMEIQEELNWHMRTVLVDWLIEIQWKSKLLPETLFLTVNIIDRFLSRKAVSLIKLQLVGLAASLLASKYEEILSPSVSNYIYFSDNAYEDQELLKAERYMLHVLNFNLAYPNPLVYLRRISKADNYDIGHRTLAKYLMELTLLDHRFIVCPPSMIAAIGMWLARDMLKAGKWTQNLVHYSGGYTEDDLRPWAMFIIEFLKKDVAKYEAAFKKYASKKLMKASIFVQEYMKKYHGVMPMHVISAPTK